MPWKRLDLSTTKTTRTPGRKIVLKRTVLKPSISRVVATPMGRSSAKVSPLRRVGKAIIDSSYTDADIEALNDRREAKKVMEEIEKKKAKHKAMKKARRKA